MIVFGRIVFCILIKRAEDMERGKKYLSDGDARANYNKTQVSIMGSQIGLVKKSTSGKNRLKGLL